MTQFSTELRLQTAKIFVLPITIQFDEGTIATDSEDNSELRLAVRERVPKIVELMPSLACVGLLR